MCPPGVTITRVVLVGTLRGEGSRSPRRVRAEGYLDLYRGNANIWNPAKYIFNNADVTALNQDILFTDNNPGNSGDYRIQIDGTYLKRETVTLDGVHVTYYHSFYLDWSLTFHYETIKTIPPSAKFFQAINGYEDRVSNYTDGPVVNTTGNTLSHPVDISHALLRDKDYGMRRPSNLVDRSDIATQRNRVGDNYRFDFAMDEVLGFDDFSKLLSEGKLAMLPGPDGKWKIQATGNSAPVAVFTHWNIDEGTFSSESTPLRDVKNHFFLRYGYSHIEETFTKSLIRSPARRGSGRGNLLSSGLFYVTQSALSSPVATGDRLLYDGRYYIVISVISATNWQVSRENGGSIVAAQEKDFQVGPNFDFICYESELRYGRKAYLGRTESAIESKFIQDDATARSYLDHLIDYRAHPASVVKFSTGLGAIYLDAGDEIICDHPYAPGLEEIGTLSGPMDWYTTSMPRNLESGASVSSGDVLVVQEGVYFEAMQAGGGTSVTRGYLNSASRRRWPSGAKIYRALRTYKITHLGLSPTRGRIDIVAREKSEHPELDSDA